MLSRIRVSRAVHSFSPVVGWQGCALGLVTDGNEAVVGREVDRHEEEDIATFDVGK